jgi:hypothetical protein
LPASSVSGMNSWGLYLISAVALVLMLTPQLTALASDSRESSDWRYMDGIREVVNSIQPGVSLNLSLVSPMAPDEIRLSGHHLSCDYGRGTLNMVTDWSLSDAIISPNSRYVLWLSGGTVMVTRIG